MFIFITARARKSRSRLTLWFVLFWFVLLYKPIPEFLVKSLEDPFIYEEEGFLELDGIIVLGGGTGSGVVARDRNDYSLEASSERIFKGLQFMRKKPNSTIIFAGFSGNIFHDGLSEAEIIQKLIEALNFDHPNILFERRSRNTSENASHTIKIIEALQINKWGIVTSASHMKRAIATFNKQSSKISFYPIPVDFQTKKSIYWGPGNMQDSLNFWHIYIHETLGYWVYKLTGKL